MSPTIVSKRSIGGSISCEGADRRSRYAFGEYETSEAGGAIFCVGFDGDRTDREMRSCIARSAAATSCFDARDRLPHALPRCAGTHQR